MKRQYEVLSPEVSETIPILDYGQGPLEHFHCWGVYEAESPAKAKAMALRDPEFKAWLWSCGDGNPFAGLRVKLHQPEADHA